MAANNLTGTSSVLKFSCASRQGVRYSASTGHLDRASTSEYHAETSNKERWRHSKVRKTAYQSYGLGSLPSVGHIVKEPVFSMLIASITSMMRLTARSTGAAPLDAFPSEPPPNSVST